MPEKILIVDDDTETLRLIGMMLERQGFIVASLNNGIQAVSIAQIEKPDLIILDVMMPDMDGYEVTRQIRNDPTLMDIPILMFTAKSQVNDKVVGYEAGVDDYLTKPVHPAELVAHIRALLSRARVRPATAKLSPKGFILGIVSPRGGMGTSTLGINLATMLANATRNDVVAAELKPSQGTWATDLGLTNDGGLASLLAHPANEITPQVVEQNLTTTTFGVRVLCSNNSHKGVNYATLADQLAAIVNGLSAISPMVVLDIGTPLLPGFDEICSLCKQVVVLVEPLPNTVSRTQNLLEDLSSITKSSGRTIDVVLYNHTPSSMLLSLVKVSEMLNGIPINVMIPPVPELTIQANAKHIPLALMQPDGLFTNQINLLVKAVLARSGG
jgi:DNA-binding response OmpR family regulator